MAIKLKKSVPSGTKKSTDTSAVKTQSKPVLKAKAAVPVKSPFSKAVSIQKGKDVDNERRKETPFRFRLKAGDSGKIIILDKGADLFSMWEHNLPDAKGHWSIFERCIKETAHCPICAVDEKESNFVVMLTVIDMRPYTDKDGKTVKYSRKLYPIKTSMSAKFNRLFERFNGDLRGVVLEVNRDGEKSVNTGNDFEFVKRLSEQELQRFKDVAKIVDYNKAFPVLTEKQLQLKYGTGDVAGSEDLSSGAWGEADDLLDDEIPF